MAPTPKRSLKRTLASTVEGRSPRFLLGSLALAMVISLLAGLGIGIKIEQHRIKTKKHKPAVAAKPTHTRPARAKLLAKAPLNGTVVQIGPKLLVIKTLKRRVAVALVPITRIEITTPATSSDIKAGSRVLFVLKPNTAATTTSAAGTTTTGATRGTGTRSTGTATEIIVVTGTAKNRAGVLVSSVTADSMTFKFATGKLVTISTVGAKIEKTAPGDKTAITAGRRVLVKTYLPPAPKKKARRAVKRAVKRSLIAIEIVVLPAHTAFG